MLDTPYLSIAKAATTSPPARLDLELSLDVSIRRPRRITSSDY
jgi:hypothetical protein